jgi:hypothetical protein
MEAATPPTRLHVSHSQSDDSEESPLSTPLRGLTSGRHHPLSPTPTPWPPATNSPQNTLADTSPSGVPSPRNRDQHPLPKRRRLDYPYPQTNWKND